MSNVYVQETLEHLPIKVKVDGVQVFVGIEVCIVPFGARPVGWSAAILLSGKIGVMLTGLALGTWVIYARVASNPETPVILVGHIKII